ncbi:MAG: DUF370 domain-containing protein [Dehalococcoidia bacterium]|nr:DUF370 domain-containing protein [Dehalococcoidia bacterium]
MAAELIHLGSGQILSSRRVVAITSPDSAPIKRLVLEGRRKGLCIDMTSGRKTRSVLILDSGHIVLASLSPEGLASRITGAPEDAASIRAGANERP